MKGRKPVKQFTEPEILIKQLDVEDVITTSGEEIMQLDLGENQTPFG